MKAKNGLKKIIEEEMEEMEEIAEVNLSDLTRVDLGIEIAKKFHRLSRIVPKYGRFWVSAAGGTANVVAGEIAKAAPISYDEAHWCLDRAAELMGIDDWYGDLYYYHGNGDFDASYRYDARDVVKWAIRSCRLNKEN